MTEHHSSFITPMEDAGLREEILPHSERLERRKDLIRFKQPGCVASSPKHYNGTPFVVFEYDKETDTVGALRINPDFTELTSLPGTVRIIDIETYVDTISQDHLDSLVHGLHHRH